jgi:xanthine dehydrogenase accessory factor
MTDISRWLASGDSPVGLATVVATWGSGPRRAGAKMAFTAGGGLSGSVSGGCVEGAVVEAGLEVLAGAPPCLLAFGVADETAWEVGLACGGTIEVFVERLDEAEFEVIRAALEADRRVARGVIVRGPAEVTGRSLVLTEDGEASGSLGAGDLDEGARAAMLALAVPGRVALGEVELFADIMAPPPVLVMVGGAHIAIALASLASVVGFRTVVVDPRRAFGSAARFPHVDRLIQAWPAEALAGLRLTAGTAIVTLSHDPKIDDPALAAALDSPAFYVGALGSRKTHAGRRERLLARGATEEALGRIHAPVGLDIGAATPEEIALAVMAEVVMAYRRRADWDSPDRAQSYPG